MYQGANQDAILIGVDLGFDAGSSITFAADADSVGASSVVLNRYLTDVRAKSKKEFAAEERTRVRPDDAETA